MTKVFKKFRRFRRREGVGVLECNHTFVPKKPLLEKLQTGWVPRNLLVSCDPCSQVTPSREEAEERFRTHSAAGETGRHLFLLEEELKLVGTVALGRATAAIGMLEHFIRGLQLPTIRVPTTLPDTALTLRRQRLYYSYKGKSGRWAHTLFSQTMFGIHPEVNVSLLSAVRDMTEKVHKLLDKRIMSRSSTRLSTSRKTSSG